MGSAGEDVRVDALGPGGAYRPTLTEPITDVTGAHVGELAQVPSLYAQRTVRTLRRARPPGRERRDELLRAAGELFARGTVDGRSAEEFHVLVARTCGMPVGAVREASGRVGDHAREACASAELARPVGAVTDWDDDRARTGTGVWTRRGGVLAVQAPANTPAVHAAWLDALALGFRVAVRPSRREPFTAHRLVAALREVGYGHDQVAFLPSDHAVGDRTVAEADVALAFGADDVVRRYRSTTLVLPQGPGRSKVLLGAGVAFDGCLDTIVESVAGAAGTGCVNATAVFVEGDPMPVATALAERLAALPSLPPVEEKAVLPVTTLDAARRLAGFVTERAGSARALLGSPVDDLGDGSAVLRPAVFVLDRADAEQARIEMGFPCVWVAPWSAADGLGPLRHTLAVTVLTHDRELVDALVEDPTIHKVHVGAHPTTWTRPGMPHEGYLGEFLMQTTAVVVDPAWAPQ